MEGVNSTRESVKDRQTAGDAGQAIEFLRSQYPEKFCLTAIIPDGATETRTFTDFDQAREWIEARNGRKNLYYEVNPVRGLLSKKADAVDIERVTAIMIDTDPRKGEAFAAERKRLATVALDLIESPCPPSCTIDSGGGWQFKWNLDPPIPVACEYGEPDNDGKRPIIKCPTTLRIEEIARRLVRRFGSDSVQSIAHLMRLPGTMNLPDKKKRSKGRVISTARLFDKIDATYTLDQLLELSCWDLDGLNEIDEPLRKKLAVALMQDEKLHKRWFKDGEGLKDDDKSDSAFGKSIAQILKAHGWSLEEVAPVIKKCPSSRDAKDLSDRAIERMYKSNMEPGAKRKGKSQREQIIDLGREFDFWMDKSGQHFVTYHRNGHYEHHRIRSQAFRDFLQQEHKRRGGSGLSRNAIGEALAWFEGDASDGPKHSYRLRVAEHGGKGYIDIGDETWNAIEFDADGWRIIDRTPVPIVRADGTAPLPIPKEGGSIELLRRYVHLGSDDDFKLFVAFLVTCLRARGPYPILNPLGQHGATKTTLSRVARLLIDPRGDDGNDVGPMPKTEDDFVVTALNAHLMTMDNLSRIGDEQSDTMCRVSTGGTLTKRKLYSDGDVFRITAERPQIVNGITDLVQRPDLGDRAITLILPKLEEKDRRAEAEFWAAFDRDAPAIFGALLDGAVRACRDMSTITGPLPRMADFAKWAAASFPAFGWKPGDFLRVYGTYQKEAAAKITESDAVALAVVEFMKDKDQWRGSASDLLPLLNGMRSFGTLSEVVDKEWPVDATRLSGRLRRAAPGLRTLGVDVDPDGKSNGIRTITINKAASDGPANRE
jgi:hypothetical protein